MCLVRFLTSILLLDLTQRAKKKKKPNHKDILKAKRKNKIK